MSLPSQIFPPDRAEMRWLGALVAVAILLRLLFCFALPNVVHADEVFQILEQAGRIVFGRGYVPWEYAIGARSWLLPAAVAPFMAVAASVSDRPEFFIGALHVLLIVFSGVLVVAAFAMARWAGAAAALWAAGLNAIWLENLYFAPHFLPDNIAAILLMAGLGIGYWQAGERAWRWVLTGLVLGLAFVVRVQLGFAIAAGIFMLCGLQWRRYLWLSAGFAVPLLVLGVIDWITWGAPFYSVYVYVLTNTSGMSAVFGVTPMSLYVALELHYWRLAAPLIILTVAVGAGRFPALAVVALVVAVTFSLVGHKEYRFIYPAIPLLLTLAGIGSAEIIARLPHALARMASGLRQAGSAGASVARLCERIAGAGGGWHGAAFVAVWGLMSLQLGSVYELRERFQNDADTLHGFAMVNDDHGSCGVGIDGYQKDGLITLTQLRRDLQFFEVDPDHFAKEQHAFNYIFAYKPIRHSEIYLEQGYTAQYCSHLNHLCVYKRPGPCDASAGTVKLYVDYFEITDVLTKLGFKLK